MRQFEVELPVGRASNGGVQRSAVLRKMTGMEEGHLYDTSLNAAQLVTHILHGCVVRLGDGVPVAEHIRDLTSSDRNYLLLELRRITLGDDLAAWYTCPACSREVFVRENLGTLAVRRSESDAALAPVAVSLDDGWIDRRGENHREVVLRLPTGADEEFVARTAERDPLRARDAMLLRCIVSFGTLPRAELEGYGIKILRELTLGDRRRLLRAFDEATPGVDFRRRIRCGHCETIFDTLLDAAAFFELG